MSRTDELRSLLMYGITGSLAAVVDVAAFATLIHVMGNRLFSAVLSFVLAAIVNYALSSSWVFRHPLSFRRFMIFFYFAGVGFFINISITIAAPALTQLDPIAGKLCGIGIAFLFNYLVNRMIVFAKISARPACF